MRDADGSRRWTIVSAAAMCMAVGNVSLDDCDMFTWSFGWIGDFEPMLPPASSIARFEMTSLAFMFDCVPEPVCQTYSGKCSSSVPSMTSSAAATISSAIAGSRRPPVRFTMAAAFFRMPNARTTSSGHAVEADRRSRSGAATARSARPSTAWHRPGSRPCCPTPSGSRHDTASSNRLTAPSSQIASVYACESLPGRLLTMDATLMAKLRAIPIFADLDDEALIRVCAVVTEFEAPAGHVLTQPGQEGSGMFILEEGTVTVELPGGGAVTLGPGEFFGELAILATGVTRTARVQAATPVRCLAVARRDFAAILEAEPDIAVAMLPVLAQRIAHLETPV